MTLSTPVKIVVLVGLVLVLAAAAMFDMTKLRHRSAPAPVPTTVPAARPTHAHHASSAATPAAPTTPAPARPATVSTPGTTAPSRAVTPATPAAPAKPATPAKPALDRGLPAPVAAALERTRRVVAFVYSGSSPGDHALLTAVRAGTAKAHLPLVLLNIDRKATATAVFEWTSSVQNPSVLVVRAPGTVVFRIDGQTDAAAVAQAAASR